MPTSSDRMKRKASFEDIAAAKRSKLNCGGEVPKSSSGDFISITMRKPCSESPGRNKNALGKKNAVKQGTLGDEWSDISNDKDMFNAFDFIRRQAEWGEQILKRQEAYWKIVGGGESLSEITNMTELP